MKMYTLPSGAKRYVPNLDEIREMDRDCDGFCVACGMTQPAEPDAVKYECEDCGKRLVFGAEQLLLRGLVEM